MPVRFKIDEDVSHDVVAVLREAGHDVETVVDEELTGAPDGSVLVAASRERRVLLTADKEFADIRKYPPGSHAGIVLFRLRRESRSGYVRLTRELLRYDLNALPGASAVLSPGGMRVRHAK